MIVQGEGLPLTDLLVLPGTSYHSQLVPA
jgi:hypothetical protein